MEQFTKNSDLADFSAQARNKKFKTQLKKISYIPGKMELSNSKNQIISDILSRGSFSNISGNKNPEKKFLYLIKRKLFLYFGKWEPQKNSCYFRK